MNINLDDNLISLGEALTHFNATLSGEGAGLRLPLREKKFARVRLAILSVVLQLTKERSLTEISVREICELAQVAQATFFNYFPSKEDVLVYYMRLWSIPVTLQCRAVVAQRTVLDAIITVFDYTAREMEQYPRLMFEIIAYIAHATEPPHPPSLSRAERLLAFPDLPGAEDVEPQSIDELFTAQLKQAVRAGELPSSLETEAVALLLKTIFYGVPLATRREGIHTIRRAYHEALEVLLGSWRTEKRSIHYEEDTEREQVLDQQFDQRMRASVERRVSPSLAVKAVRGDDTVIERGYGWSDLEQGTNASAETVYLYCSITKLFTATALMQLRERGLVDINREVRTYLPDFPLHHSSGREVTVRHLLSHSSGIANPIPVSWVHLAEEPAVNLDDFTRRLLAKYHRLTFEPGSRYAYSNLGYLVLGQVIERISGQRYTDYIQQHILEVLDMHRTGFSYDHLQDQDVATGYVRSWSMMGILGRFLVDRRIFSATRNGYTAFHRFLIDGAPYGGLLGPVSDLGNFLKAYLSGGIFQGRRLLEPSSIDEMLTPQRNHRGEELSTSGREMPQRVGLGWHLAGGGEMRSCYHIGGGAGYRSELRIYPSLGYGIGVMGNETSYKTGAITRIIVSEQNRVHYKTDLVR